MPYDKAHLLLLGYTEIFVLFTQYASDFQLNRRHNFITINMDSKFGIKRLTSAYHKPAELDLHCCQKSKNFWIS